MPTGTGTIMKSYSSSLQHPPLRSECPTKSCNTILYVSLYCCTTLWKLSVLPYVFLSPILFYSILFCFLLLILILHQQHPLFSSFTLFLSFSLPFHSLYSSATSALLSFFNTNSLLTSLLSINSSPLTLLL